MREQSRGPVAMLPEGHTAEALTKNMAMELLAETALLSESNWRTDRRRTN